VKAGSLPEALNGKSKHVRPIVRGKAGRPTEFGAKLSVSYVDEFIFLDRLSWENFNESMDLKTQVENFKETYGCYPHFSQTELRT